MSFWGTRPSPFTSSEVAILTTIAGTSYTDGQLLIGNSSTGGLSVATITAGSNITVTNGHGIITIAASGGGSSALTVGTTTIASGTSTRILYDNAGTLGEYTITGTGTVVAMQTSPSFTTPTLGVALATSINGLIVTTTTGTLTITGSKVLTISNTLTFAGTDSTTMTFPSTSATIARTDAANTFTGHQTIEGVTSTGATGTGNLVFATSPTVTLASASTAVTQSAGDNTTAVATDAFVTTAIANAVAGNNPVASVSAATTSSSNTSAWTYVHVAGIGDTFTGPVNTAIVIDGFTFTTITSQSLLVKNDTQTASGAVTAGTYNGVYNLTALQTVGTGAIFTRRLDYDTPADINGSGVVPVINGTANALTTWLQTNTIAAVGTGTSNNLAYSQFSYSPTAIIPPSLGGTGIANNASSTITISGNFGTTLTVTATTAVTLPTSGTLVNTGVATLSSLVSVGTITTGGLGTGATIAGVTMSLGSDAVGDIYAATTSNVLSRIAAVAAGQVLISKGTTTLPAWSSSATLSNLICSNNAVTASGNAATVPVTSRLTTVTNNSAATLTITITTSGAVDGQLVMVRILDSSAAAQTITWTNTENSTVTAPTTSNGSTTLFLTVGFIYNSGTSKWRCIASA